MRNSVEGGQPPIENINSDKSPGISRRALFKGGAATIGALIAWYTGRRYLPKAVQIGQGMSEVARSHAASHEKFIEDNLHIVGTELEREANTFKVLRIYMQGTETGHRTNVAAHVFDQRVSAVNITPISSLYREELLHTTEQEMLIGPVTYLSGQYHRDDEQAGVNVGFQLPVTDSNRNHFGPLEVVDRFPGRGEDLNTASGGLAIIDGYLHVVNKQELNDALRRGDPGMQMVYYIDEQNAEKVLNETWQHFSLPGPLKEAFDTTLPIGNTTYWWSAYVQTENSDGTWADSIIVADDKDAMCPIWFIAKLAQGLSETGRYKIALADAGNGSTVLGKDNNGQFANGVNEFDTHLTPAAITITPRQ